MNEVSASATMPPVARRVGVALLDFVFPSRCHVCGEWDRPSICTECGDAFETMPLESCPRCPRPATAGPCGTCTAAVEHWGHWNFASARAAFVFDGAIRRLIHEMKYRGQLHLADPLGEWAASRVAPTGSSDFDLVVAMPGDPWRSVRRGGNPVDGIAKRIARHLGCRVLPPGALRRGAATAQMARSSEERRSARLRFHMDPRRADAIRDAHVLLVDDVFTTGASVHAAAGVLRGAGARCVSVWTVAAGG